MGFSEQRIDCIPQVFRRMQNVQHEGMGGKVRLDLRLERFAPISQRDPMLDMCPLPPKSLFPGSDLFKGSLAHRG